MRILGLLEATSATAQVGSASVGRADVAPLAAADAA